MGQRKENKVFPFTPVLPGLVHWGFISFGPEAGMLGIGERLTPPGAGLASGSPRVLGGL